MHGKFKPADIWNKIQKKMFRIRIGFSADPEPGEKIISDLNPESTYPIQKREKNYKFTGSKNLTFLLKTALFFPRIFHLL